MSFNVDLHSYGWLTFERSRFELPGISYRGPRTLQRLADQCHAVNLAVTAFTNFGDRRYEQLRDTALQLPSDYAFTDLLEDGQSIALRVTPPGKSPVFILRGQQVLTKEGNLTTVGAPRQLRDGLTLEDSIKEAKDTGALVIAVNPHTRQGAGGEVTPGLEAYTKSIGTATLVRTLDRFAGFYDAVQIFSASSWPRSFSDLLHYGRVNAKAETYAEQYNLPGIAVSEAHAPHHMGLAYITIPRLATKDARSLLESIRSNLATRNFTLTTNAVSRLGMARCLAADIWNHISVDRGWLQIRRD